MKSTLKSEARKTIEDFFSRKSFSSNDVRKIKILAMKHSIKLGAYRLHFCKKCLSKLKGKTRLTKSHRITLCGSCGFKNRFRIVK